MKVFTTKRPGQVRIQIRAESEEGSIVGDAIETLKPGDTFLDKPYEWWASLADGEHDVT